MRSNSNHSGVFLSFPWLIDTGVSFSGGEDRFHKPHLLTIRSFEIREYEGATEKLAFVPSQPSRSRVSDNPTGCMIPWWSAPLAFQVHQFIYHIE